MGELKVVMAGAENIGGKYADSRLQRSQTLEGLLSHFD